ncbi:MAG: Na+/H+ antiporter NhaA [Alphaproteobacteria bacterium]|nr:Na+/H+ antiporter NhaA [Alphaproteobacteria bacterium]
MSGQRNRPAVAARFAPLLAFFRGESAGGAALLVAAAVALAWSNSPAGDSYARLVRLPVRLGLGLDWPLQTWINDGLMTFFFLLVSLEIRREMTTGELASPRRFAAPALAALGGVALPAVIYSLFNWSNPVAMRGWAIPVATDIAFSLGVLAVLGRRAPVALKVFLAALAIIDDLVAIVVIALFYTHRLAPLPLLGAALAWAALYGLGRAGVRARGVYLLGGVVIWATLLRSGVHPTLAGVALAFAVPNRPDGGATSVAVRLEATLDRLVPFVIVPLFALANAGFRVDVLVPARLADPVVLGIAIGLFLGKQLGVFGTLMGAWRLGIAHPPGRLTPMQLYGAALLCGIGFTMSLFIGDLAFRGQERVAEVKLAVFLGSLVSALAGLAVLAVAARRDARGPHASLAEAE